MVSWKCLATLCRLMILPDAQGDLVLASQRSAGPFDGGVDGGQVGFGGGQQLVAFAGPFGGERRVAAGDEPLAGIVGVGDLGQVVFVEQATAAGRRSSARARMAGARSEVIQPSPPTALSASMRALVIIPRSPTSTTSVSPKRSRTVGRGGDEGGRIGGVAGEDLDRDRAAFGVAGEPVFDLVLAGLAVTGVATGGERAAVSFHPRARQVIEHPAAGAEVPAGQGCFDVGLATRRASPSPRTRRRRWRRSTPRSSARVVLAHQRVVASLEAGPHRPGDDQGERQVTLAARRSEQLGDAELVGHRRHRGDVAVGQGPFDLPVGAGLDERAGRPVRRGSARSFRPAGATGWRASRSSPCRPRGRSGAAAWVSYTLSLY